jgi:hypothetical protein
MVLGIIYLYEEKYIIEGGILSWEAKGFDIL